MKKRKLNKFVFLENENFAAVCVPLRYRKSEVVGRAKEWFRKNVSGKTEYRFCSHNKVIKNFAVTQEIFEGKTWDDKMKTYSCWFVLLTKNKCGFPGVLEKQRTNKAHKKLMKKMYNEMMEVEYETFDDLGF